MPDWLTGDLFGDIARGVLVTVTLTLVTSLASMAVGICAALGRVSETTPKRRTATAFIELFRNVPSLVLLIFFAFAVPNLFPSDLRRSLFFDNAVVDGLGAITGLPIPYYAIAGVIALTTNTGAHIAEIVRSGIQAVPSSQIEAARTLGATRAVVRRTIVVPDALRITFPAITNRLVHNLKNTALVGLVAVPDAFQVLQGAITRTFQATQILVFAALLYLVLTTLLELALRRVEVALWRGRPVRRSADV